MICRILPIFEDSNNFYAITYLDTQWMNYITIYNIYNDLIQLLRLYKGNIRNNCLLIMDRD